jgi:Na+/H+-dicarboxylate symporter
MKIKKVLLHPLTIFLSMAMGAYLGFCFPSLGPMAGSLGSLYLNCFQMCVLPLITAAVFNSVLSLCSNIEGMIGFLKKLISLFCFGMLGTTISGVIISVLFSSGSKIDVTSQGILGSFVNKESNISDKLVLRNGLDFLHMIIPQNPFTAFAEGSGLKVLFFSIVMGIAFSRGNKERVDLWSNIMGELFDSCIRVLNFLVLLLPFGMVFIFANQFSLITFDVINALGKFLSLSIITIFAFIFLNIFILKLSSGKKFLETIKGISGTIALAFASSSCFVTMPQMISELEQNFKISSSKLKLIIPLGINMSPSLRRCITLLLISMYCSS